MMRFLLGGLLIFLAAVYAATASYFYQQESWARAPVEVGVVSADRLRHPDATLGIVRHAIESGDFSNPIEPYLLQSLSEAPASYQSSFLLAAFLANRLEDPERTEWAFDTALGLFPANGRLHLSYAQWLLSPKSGAPRWMDVGGPVWEEGPALRERALGHLRAAPHLQEDLVPASLKWLAWSGVPSSEWKEFVPDTLSARGQLARALADSGNRKEALGVLTSTIRTTSEKRFFYDAAMWAFEWGAPAVALEAGKRWLGQERDASRAGIQFTQAALVVARAHLELGDSKLAYQVFEVALATIEAETEASSPANLELLAGMADLYLKVDQPVMAQSLLLKATELAPHNSTVWLALARAYRKAGNETLSIQSYREVLRLQPENSQAARELPPLLLRSRLLAGGS